MYLYEPLQIPFGTKQGINKSKALWQGPESKAGLALRPPRSCWGSGTHIAQSTLGAVSPRSMSKVQAALSRKHRTLECLVENKNTLEFPVHLSLHLGFSAERICLHVARAKALNYGQRRDLPYSSLCPQGLAHNLAQSRCSINACETRKLSAGRAVSWHRNQHKQRLDVCTVRPMPRV